MSLGARTISLGLYGTLSEPPIRASILVKGKVQKANFRDFVEDLARSQHLYGKVANLRNYDRDVEIVCEGPRVNIEGFLEDVRKKARAPVQIEDMKVDYKAATGEFSDFIVLRGSAEAELGERLTAGLDGLTSISGKLDNVSSGLGTVNESLSGFSRDTHEDFEELDRKYSSISKKLNKLDRLDSISSDIRRLVNYISAGLPAEKRVSKKTKP